ncbi:MAG: carbohydrate ABC transporter permease [Acutalibacteraceae bacterium]|nr:carbohydrate ABC transporter permease [Acutalibacteraceae bacterium]
MNIPKSKLISRKTKEGVTKFVVGIIRWVFLLSISYILLYPMLYMLSSAFRAPEDFIDPTVVWVSKNFSVKNFVIAFKALDYLKTFWSTFKIEIVSAFIEIVMCSITAYGLARFDFKEKKLLMGMLIATILIPTQMIMVPLMVNMRYLDVFGILGAISKLVGTELRPNLLNTPWAFYLPSIFAVGLKAGLFTYMYVQFFKGLPKELEEAASIDGAGPVKTFLTIVVPSSGTIFLTVTIFSIIWHWNDTYLSSLFLSGDYPLSVQLSRIFTILGAGIDGVRYGQYNRSTIGIVMAACLLVILPMLIMYCILQKRFIKSIDRVGIVG